MKKTLMIATAALALTAGAATAQAGYGYGYSSGYGHGYNTYNYVAPSCYTVYKKVKIRVYGYYGYHYKWIVKPVEVCY